jgi:hypothetical protein
MGAVVCQGLDSNTRKMITFINSNDIYNNVAGRQNTDKKKQSKELLIQGNELKITEHMSK